MIDKLPHDQSEEYLLLSVLEWLDNLDGVKI